MDLSLDLCHCGYLSADSDLFHDIVSVRLHTDMQSAEIYIYNVCIDLLVREKNAFVFIRLKESNQVRLEVPLVS